MHIAYRCRAGYHGTRLSDSHLLVLLVVEVILFNTLVLAIIKRENNQQKTNIYIIGYRNIAT